MNFYEQPAQAQFVNTYVPIPFEQLMSVASAYKQDYDRNLEALRQFNKEAGEFQSLSTKDIGTWKAATTDRLAPIVDQMAANPDALKDISNRAALNNIINSTDYSLLSKLKSNAAVLSEAAKTYDPRWEDDTMEQIANWDTNTQGLYTGRNIAYQNLQEVSNPYFDLLGKEKFLGRSKDGMYDEYGITEEHLQTVADDKTINEIYSSPEGKKHVELARKRGIVPEGMSDREWLRDAVIQSQIGRVGVTRREENRFALESYKENLRRATLKSRGKKEEQPTTPTTKYDHLQIDADNALQSVMANSGYFDNTVIEVAQKITDTAREEVLAVAEAFKNGNITAEQKANNEARIIAEANLKLEPLAKKEEARFSNGVNKMFEDISGINLRTGSSTKKKDTQFYSASVYRAANRVIDVLAPTSSDASYLDSWTNVETSSGGKYISLNGIPTNSFNAKSTAGAELVIEYVNKLAGGNLRFNYDVPKTDGTKGDIAKGIKNGEFENVILVPTYKTLTQTNANGEKELVQKYTVLIPAESVQNAGYDKKVFEKAISTKLGGSTVTNLSTKNTTEDQVKNAIGTTKSGGFLGWGEDVDRVPQPLVGDFYKVEVMKPMPRRSSVTNTTESLYDKKIGGTSYGKETIDYRALDTYGSEEDKRAALYQQLYGNEN